MKEIAVISADSTTTSDRGLLFKHDFVRSFKPMPVKISEERRELIAALAGQEFSKLFPDIAAAIKEAVEEESPLFIDRFPLGYQRPITSPRVSEKRQKIDYCIEADKILAMAVIHLMGFGVTQPLDTAKSINVSRGGLDKDHDHDTWSVVIGVFGVDDVKTSLYDVESDGYAIVKKQNGYSGAFELHRGSVLLIPPYMYHGVEEFDKSLEKERVTIAYFPRERSKYRFDLEDLRQGRQEYMRDPRGAAHTPG